MSEQAIEEQGKAGLWTAAIGALLILIDGAAVLASGNFYGWHYASATVTGWIEIILSIIMYIALYWYKSHPAAVGWTIVILALITMPFDGGFWTIGAWIALAGGVLIAYRK
ncbi:MAG: hypothetical protein F7C38_05980 [Desulfurococcales archaeon]|nr:hypothetical protein [Desulfurococcales archaeon]